MNIKKATLIFLLGILCIFSNAQQDSSAQIRAKNSVFVEFGGNGGGRNYLVEGFSINYDRIFHVGRFTQASVRIGSNIPINDHLIPIMMNLLFGKKKFHFEVGGGIRLFFFDSNYRTADYELISFFGLRYQNYKKGIMAKVGFTPPFGPYLLRSYFFGISLGYSF